jgi:hypothetical protein
MVLVGRWNEKGAARREGERTAVKRSCGEAFMKGS